MTLVVRMSVHEHPLLIGDILISSPEIPGRALNVPTIGNITSVFPEGSGFAPTDLTQKIAILGDKFVIGWAGSRLHAKAVISELLEENRKEPLSRYDLMSYFENMDASTASEVDFTGWLWDAEGFSYFGFGCQEFPSSALGEVGLLGSGSGEMKRYLSSQLTSIPLATMPINPLAQAYGLGLTISGVMLSDELASRHSLLNFYGGGYEIVSLLEGKFQKLSDVTYLFWHCIKIGENLGVNLYQVSKYHYENDILLIRTATPSDHSIGIAQSTREEPNDYVSTVHVVSPVYRTIAEQERLTLTPPDLNSIWQCHYFILQEKEILTITSAVLYNFEGEPPVRFTEADTMLELYLKMDTIRNLYEQAKNTFNQI